jgi:hypothetical protein
MKAKYYSGIISVLLTQKEEVLQPGVNRKMSVRNQLHQVKNNSEEDKLELFYAACIFLFSESLIVSQKFVSLV